MLPDLEDYENFSVVACDQYSSQPEYWEEVEKQLQDRTSALSFILPEAWIGTPKGAAHQQGISARMEKALNESFLRFILIAIFLSGEHSMMTPFVRD